jgi:hypothetical protein
LRQPLTERYRERLAGVLSWYDRHAGRGYRLDANRVQHFVLGAFNCRVAGRGK